MPGESNYGGNGSVHWEVRCKQQGGADAPLMPWGKEGSGVDRTRHHYFTHAHNAIQGHDPDLPGANGQRSNLFSVGMRYYVDAVTDPLAVISGASLGSPRSGAAARGSAVVAQKEVVLALLDQLIADAQAARARIEEGAPQVDVTAHVPLKNRREMPTDGWEINVRW